MQMESHSLKMVEEEEEATHSLTDLHHHFSLPDYVKETARGLSWKSPTARAYGHLWVFWSKVGNCPQTVTSASDRAIMEKIKAAFCKLLWLDFVSGGSILAQFWAPRRIEGRCVLTTSDQPFAVRGHTKGSIDRGLWLYRQHCKNFDLIVEGEGSNDYAHLGPTGRVFRHRLPESSPDVRLYSCDEFPQRDLAVASGVKTVLALPVFEPSSEGRCVGVVEVIGTDTSFFSAIWEVDVCLQEVDLRCLHEDCIFDTQISEGLHRATDEIDKMLEIACKTLQLPLAQTWTPCAHSNGSTNGDNFHLKCTDTDSDKWVFSSLCTYRPLRKGEGLVGKAILFHKPCFCSDISQFSINEYPLAHHAREFGLTSSFAICLWSTYTGDLDYVLEFFLPRCGPGTNGDVKTLLGSILATMKEHLPSFLVALGTELAEELSADRVIEYLICCDELYTSNACRTIQSPSTPEALENEGGIVQLDLSNQQSLVDDGTENGRDLGTVQQSCAVITNTTENTCIVSERGEVYARNSLSYDILKQHFEKKLEDVAEIFGVSRSTLKRACRNVGISEWPSCKINNVNRTRCNFKKMKGSIQGRAEGAADCSRTDPTLDVASSVLRGTAMQDITLLTIKVIHGEDVIKFQMPHSSRMAELFENLTERLPLKVGTFRIKYQDEDGDWVLIACEKDLQYCITSSRSSATIKMLVQPLSDQEL